MTRISLPTNLTRLITILLLGALVASSRAEAADGVDYARQIKPLLAQKCLACHGALKQESGLRLDAATLIRQGGDSGPVIVPGSAGASLLIGRVTADDPDERMPPQGEGERLNAEQTELLRRWIDSGAKAPADESIPQDPRKHWAYLPPQRPALPVLASPDGTGHPAGVANQVDEPKPAGDGNPLDLLLAVQHQQHGLTPALPASPEILLRRVYLDLIGLPPTRDQLRAFLQDPSPEAYEREVDRLLGSPAYGQRWGRHWMDVWRYSDWTGFGNEIRYSQRHIWRWRDWIVESLNADRGYDQMILEMLAADELVPDDERANRASGFLARNWYKFDRDSWLDDTIEHTGKAFLGMTLKCARCHDHKYDPITQQEYYRFRAIFEPYDVRTDQVPGQRELDRDGLVRVFDAKPDAATYLFVRGDPKRADQQQPLTPGVPSVVEAVAFEVRPVPLPLTSYYPAIRSSVTTDLIATVRSELAAAKLVRDTAQSALEAARTAASAGGSSTAANDKSEEASSSTPAAGSQPTAVEVERTEYELALAELKLASAEARMRAAEARVAAELAKHKDPDQAPDDASVDASFDASVDGSTLALAASSAERAAALADAREKLFIAQRELVQAQLAVKPDDEKTTKAVEAAQTKLEAASKSRDTAEQAAGQTAETYSPLGPTYPPTSTGRRLALARWIVDCRNPLTARVAVNHIWLRHFDVPLFDNMDDLGLRTPRPPLADVLDYLAVEFMEHGWSMKHLHRLIVTSQAYRMESRANPGNEDSRRRDPDNRLLWRMNPRRLEAETVRDGLLYVSGDLDLAAGGPDIDPTLGPTVPRRSLYFRHARERQVPFLQIFDAADPRECYRRQASIRPQQAFALVNSSLPLAQSRRLASRLTSAVASADRTDIADDNRQQPGSDQDDEPFIEAAFETILARRPTAEELATCQRFLDLQAGQLADLSKLELLGTLPDKLPASADPRQRARENLVLVLFNHNDFVTAR